ncbi:MAG: DUF177 domain-containing protein [Pseudomonadota bacterium]
MADSIAETFTRIMTVEEAHRQIDPLSITATPEEGTDVARRFDWLGVKDMAATLRFSGSGTVVVITGNVRASVTQACVATARPITTRVDAPFTVRLVPMAQMEVEAEACEVELSDVALDSIGYDDARFDLADIIAETLALSLDPWPRRADADEWLRAQGVMGEQDVGPFAGLAALKAKLEKP